GFAGLQGKSGGKLLTTAETRNRATAGKRLGGFGVEAQGLGSRVELFAGLDAALKLRSPGLRQLRGLLLLQFGEHFLPDFLERSLVSGKNLLDGDDHIAPVCADGEAQVALTEAEELILNLLRVAEFEEGFVGRDGPRLRDAEVILLGEPLEGGLVGLANLRGDLVGDVAGFRIHFLQEQRGTNRVLDLFKGRGVGGFLVKDLDDVEAVLSANEAGHLALVKTEGGLLKFGDSLALHNPTEVAALGLAAGIFGELLGEFLKVGALLARLCEDILGFLPDLFDFRVGLASHGQEKNVLDVDAVGHLVLLDVLLVKGFELVVGDGDGLAKLSKVDEDVASGALFGNLEIGFVLVVVGFDFAVIGINSAQQIIGLDQDVIELHFFVLVAELILDFGEADANAIGDELAELFLHEAGAHEILKDGHGHLEALLDFPGVGIHADESIAVESGGHVHADAVGAFLFTYGDAHAFGFVFHFLLEDELIQDLARIEGFDLLGNVVVTANIVELLVHFGEGDGLIAHAGHDVRGSFRGIGALRHEIEEHAHGEHANDDAEEDSDAGFLVRIASHAKYLPNGSTKR